MGKLVLDISMSLDGFVAGPDQSLDQPLGAGGERLHEWAFVLESFRKRHGLPGGETNVDSEVVEQSLQNTGATVMGRRMFSGGAGPWDDDPNADAWWGDDPPFHHPVFVLTHHGRDPVNKHGGSPGRASDPRRAGAPRRWGPALRGSPRRRVRRARVHGSV